MNPTLTELWSELVLKTELDDYFDETETEDEEITDTNKEITDTDKEDQLVASLFQQLRECQDTDFGHFSTLLDENQIADRSLRPFTALVIALPVWRILRQCLELPSVKCFVKFDVVLADRDDDIVVPGFFEHGTAKYLVNIATQTLKLKCLKWGSKRPVNIHLYDKKQQKAEHTVSFRLRGMLEVYYTPTKDYFACDTLQRAPLYFHSAAIYSNQFRFLSNVNQKQRAKRNKL